MAHYDNVLATNAASGQLCKAGNETPQVLQITKNAGFDALFNDLEHSTLSVADASAITGAGLLSGLTPFARLPYQCGMGSVQQVFDGGAMGIIYPHIRSAADAQTAVDMSKLAPLGRRSIWGQQPVLGLQARPLHYVAKVCNKAASSVLLMIEGTDGINNIDEIAAVGDVDVLLVGCIDLSTDMGVPGGFETKAFREALGGGQRGVPAPQGNHGSCRHL